MNNRVLVLGIGVAVCLLLVTIGVFFFFKPTVTIEPMKVYELPDSINRRLDTPQVVTETAPVVAHVSDTNVASTPNTITDDDNLSAWGTFLEEKEPVDEGVVEALVSEISDDMLAAFNPPEPPSDGFNSIMEGLTEANAEEKVAVYVHKYYPLVPLGREFVSQQDERVQREYYRQKAALDEDVFSSMRASIPEGLVEHFPRQLTNDLRKVGIVK